MPTSGANPADDATALDDALQHAGLSPDEAALKINVLTQALVAHGVCTIGRRQRVLRLLHERLAQSKFRTVAPPSQPSTPPPVQSPLTSPLTPPQTLPQSPTMPPDAKSLPLLASCQDLDCGRLPFGKFHLTCSVDVPDALAVTPSPSANEPPAMWRVVFFPHVFIRASPSFSAAKLSSLAAGACVSIRFVQSDHWARLEHAEEQWVLTDGTAIGLPQELLLPFPQRDRAAVDAALEHLASGRQLALAGQITAAASRLDDGLMCIAELDPVLRERETTAIFLEKIRAFAHAIALDRRQHSGGAGVDIDGGIGGDIGGDIGAGSGRGRWRVSTADAAAAAAPSSVDEAQCEYEAVCLTAVSAPYTTATQFKYGWEVLTHAAVCVSDSRSRSNGRFYRVCCYLCAAALNLAMYDTVRMLDAVASEASTDQCGLLLCEFVDLAKRKQAALKDVTTLESDVATLGDSQADDRAVLSRWEASVRRMMSTPAGRQEMVQGGLAEQPHVDACTEDELLSGSGRARRVLLGGIHVGLLHHAKRKMESGIASWWAQHTRLGPGVTGGRYRCVAPERVFTAGLASLFGEDAPTIAANVETLRHDRLVVLDGVLPANVLLAAQAEAFKLEALGRLRGEHKSSCNPGEISTEFGLWDAHRRRQLKAESPALFQTVQRMWNLGAELGKPLGLEVRVPTRLSPHQQPLSMHLLTTAPAVPHRCACRRSSCSPRTLQVPFTTCTWTRTAGAMSRACSRCSCTSTGSLSAAVNYVPSSRTVSATSTRCLVGCASFSRRRSSTRCLRASASAERSHSGFGTSRRTSRGDDIDDC